MMKSSNSLNLWQHMVAVIIRRLLWMAFMSQLNIWAGEIALIFQVWDTFSILQMPLLMESNIQILDLLLLEPRIAHAIWISTKFLILLIWSKSTTDSLALIICQVPKKWQKYSRKKWSTMKNARYQMQPTWTFRFQTWLSVNSCRIWQKKIFEWKS